MLNMFAEIARLPDAAMPFVLSTVGQASPQPPVSRANGYSAHHLIWVKEGCGDFCMGDAPEERFTLEAGEGVFMRAGVPHSYEGKHFCTAWCTFSMPESVLDHLGVGDYLRFRVPTDLTREAEELYRFACGESTLLSRSAAGYSLVMGLFDRILSDQETVSMRVRRILERRCAEPLTLDDLAREVGIDRYTLCRVYKRERGITVMDDLNDIRIAKAKKMLRYSSDPVETIGQMCGFASPSYFGKRFRQAVGCPPAVYRK